MEKIDVGQLTEVQETLLIPLWARAEESRHPSPLLRDPKAVELVEAIDYDFDRFRRAGANQPGFCVRAAIIDDFVRQFLQQHPDGTVVEIGAGLDTRFDRLDNGQVRWFDLDLPEAMQVRQQLFEPTDRRTFLTTSVLDFQWLDQLDVEDPEKLLFVSEGVLLFFQQQDVARLFRRLADHAPGSAIIFDTHSPLFVWYSNVTHPLSDSRMVWGMRRVEDVARWDPRLRLEAAAGFGDSPHYDGRFHRLSQFFQLVRRVFPPARNMFRINRVRLGGRSVDRG